MTVEKTWGSAGKPTVRGKPTMRDRQTAGIDERRTSARPTA
jgi:hypothetical protein